MFSAVGTFRTLAFGGWLLMCDVHSLKQIGGSFVLAGVAEAQISADHFPAMHALLALWFHRARQQATYHPHRCGVVPPVDGELLVKQFVWQLRQTSYLGCLLSSGHLKVHSDRRPKSL